jgi:hypothetical protein
LISNPPPALRLALALPRALHKALAFVRRDLQVPPASPVRPDSLDHLAKHVPRIAQTRPAVTTEFKVQDDARRAASRMHPRRVIVSTACAVRTGSALVTQDGRRERMGPSVARALKVSS